MAGKKETDVDVSYRQGKTEQLSNNTLGILCSREDAEISSWGQIGEGEEGGHCFIT